MASRSVCISPTDGSGGELVGPMVAEALGLQLINAQIVTRAAEEAGVDPAAVMDAEGRRSLATRLLGRLTDAGPVATEAEADPEALREVIRAVIVEAGERGDAVIVTHAASYALAGRTDVLRVLISASPGSRAERIAEAKGWNDDAAAKAVARGDAGRAAYLKRFYGIDAELPEHYDLVIDTDEVDAVAAAELIVRAARSHAGPPRD